ncbi:MAG: hypothetical protein HZB65_03825 [Candidatus Aenigmarchaeota archaeon]|nr:hypothetical protein [Candidatus Aenigmarchaeota archaeon]
MDRIDILRYYSQDFVAEMIAKASQDREVVGVFADSKYEKRPGILQYSSDVIGMAKRGITSIHLSAEHWTYPMQLISDNYDELRKGFDIILDIDSKLGLDESKTAAILICRLFERYDIKNFGLKFSGRRGFHICLPWKMLPKTIDFKPMEKEYPRIPRIISNFIRHNIREDLLKEILKNKTVAFDGEIDPFQFVEVEKDWGNRHLFRAPLSLNEKTWLVSLPLDLGDVKEFYPDMAKPDRVKSAKPFFRQAEENEAEMLVSDALDWHAVNTKFEKPKQSKEIKQPMTNKIDEEFFPPCIKLILAGLKDGKKRSLFTIISFLKQMNWSWEEIAARLDEMNAKNIPALPRQAIKSQINWARQQNKQINPANCKTETFYKGLGICQPDERCKTIKNPMNYPFLLLSQIKKREPKKLKCYSCAKEFDDMDKLLRHKKRCKG